jgi:hypothetical protein
MASIWVTISSVIKYRYSPVEFSLETYRFPTVATVEVYPSFPRNSDLEKHAVKGVYCQ